MPAAGASAAQAVPKLIAVSSAQPAAYCIVTSHLARPLPLFRSLHISESHARLNPISAPASFQEGKFTTTGADRHEPNGSLPRLESCLEPRLEPRPDRRISGAVAGSIAEVSIIDRETGVVLSPHYYRGEYWVAGRPGAKYAIEVRNRLGDGCSLSPRSTESTCCPARPRPSTRAVTYSPPASDSAEITGWRKSDAEIAVLHVHRVSKPYAERTGRPENVGVIGVALFRERQPPSVWVAAATAGFSEALVARELRRRGRHPLLRLRLRRPVRRPGPIRTLAECPRQGRLGGGRWRRLRVRPSRQNSVPGNGEREYPTSTTPSSRGCRRTERDPPHPLRQPRESARHGRREAPAAAAPDDEPVPRLAGAAIRTRSTRLS